VLTKIEYGNGTSTTFAYEDDDPRYPLHSITHYSPSDTVLQSLTYASRDKALNPLSVTDSRFGSVSFGPYDALGRLTTASYPDPIPNQPAGGTYGYDWLGNRLHPPSDPNPMVYNECDQLTSWPGMYAYEYDPAGNLIRTRARDSQGPVAAEYSYTADGLLATATCGGTTTLTNAWNAMGNRVGLTVGSESYSFTYNPVASVPAVIVESGGGKTYYYVRDPSGVLIARCEASTPDDYQYYHFDELGSTRLLTDVNGDVTDEYTYDAYGATISHVGPTHDNPYQWVGALGYYTHHQAPEFKLIQLGFRFYDPEIGRFTQQDPIGDGLNWYEYCGGNPVGAVDPWGLARCECPPQGSPGGGGLLDGMQTALDVAGLVPGLGEFADGLNGFISLGRGDFVGAGLSFVSMVPVVGDAIGKGGKAARLAARVSRARRVSAARRTVTELHHIVERRNILRRGWDPGFMNSSMNTTPLPTGFHLEVSRFYSSRQEWLTGGGYSTVRQWMDTMSLEQQYSLGFDIMEYLKSGVWPH
jgi:RHS repeat-associated protein